MPSLEARGLAKGHATVAIEENAPDPAVRANRLAMLHGLLEQFRTFADFSEIVTNS